MSEHRTYWDAPVEVSKTVSFEAAHRMERADDREPYKRIHGHSFQLTATLRGRPDPERGWVDDLGELSEALKALAERLDHGLLNEVEGLERPTLERICAWAAGELRPRFPALARVAAARPSLGEICVMDVA